jgi:hypothetical protein
VFPSEIDFQKAVRKASWRSEWTTRTMRKELAERRANPKGFEVPLSVALAFDAPSLTPGMFFHLVGPQRDDMPKVRKKRGGKQKSPAVPIPKRKKRKG